MCNFMNVTIVERVDGAPSGEDTQEIDIVLNLDQITILNGDPENPEFTYVRMTCGGTLLVLLPYLEFMKILGFECIEEEKPAPKKKPAKKKAATKRKTKKAAAKK